MAEIEVKKVPAAEDRALPVELDRYIQCIKDRAYSLFEGRGYLSGGDLDDWLAAERELGCPAAELVEANDEFVLKVALAGFRRDDVNVTATPDEIVVEALREDESSSTDEGSVHWTEMQRDKVYRRVVLPSPVEVGDVTAKLKHGMLTIVARKASTPEEGPNDPELSTAAEGHRHGDLAAAEKVWQGV